MVTRTSPPATPKNSITQSGKTIYLNNKELLNEVKNSKAAGRMTNTLAKMLQLLCAKYAKKGNFVNYSYNEDMQAYAMMMLVRTWNSFDPEKGSNAFAFFTQCVKNSFIQYLNQEQRQRDTRDALLVAQGLNPSYGFDDDDGEPKIHDEQDFHTMKALNDALSKDRYVDAPIERDETGIEVAVDIPEDDEDAKDLVQY